MFSGEYAHTLDHKGRLIIPARFRPLLTEKAILTRGLDQHLVIYPEEAWNNVLEQLNQIPITHPSARALRRLIYSGAVQLGLDKQGRATIPAYLRSYAQIDTEVLLVGMETFIEVWEPGGWQKALEDVASIIADSDLPLSLNL